METLAQRHMLATDLFVGPLTPIPDSIDAQTASAPSLATDAKAAVGEAESLSGEGEVVAANANSSALQYDVNGDKSVSPIDALLVINASIELRAGHGISDEAFAAFDVNRDGVLSNDDIDGIVEQVEAAGRNASQDPSANGLDGQSSSRPDGTPGTSRLHVASFRDIASGAFVTLESQSHSLASIQSRALSPEQARSDAAFGLIAFEVHNVQPDSVVEVTVVLPSGSTPSGYLDNFKGSGLVVFDSSPSWPASGAEG